jgi:hypothetical protein
LRHLNIANLYVGDLEIQIFKEVLALARDAACFGESGEVV